MLRNWSLQLLVTTRRPTLPRLATLALAAGATGLMACGSQSASNPGGFGQDATPPGTMKDAGKRDTGTTKLGSTDSGGTCGQKGSDQKGCPCTVGQTVTCYGGPAGTLGIGDCASGTQRCQASGEFASFGPCLGEVLPSASDECVAMHVPPPKDAAPPPPKDAGVPPPDANPIEVVVGTPCTPGQTEMGPGSYPCSGSITECGCGTTCTCTCDDAGTPSTMTSVYFCDSGGVWDQFPAGTCEASTCTSCMQTNCASIVAMGGAGTACEMGLQQALNWLAACGPDRASIFQTFGAACTAAGQSGLLEQIEICKDTSCTGTGVCSFW